MLGVILVTGCARSSGGPLDVPQQDPVLGADVAVDGGPDVLLPPSDVGLDVGLPPADADAGADVASDPPTDVIACGLGWELVRQDTFRRDTRTALRAGVGEDEVLAVDSRSAVRVTRVSGIGAQEMELEVPDSSPLFLRARTGRDGAAWVVGCGERLQIAEMRGGQMGLSVESQVEGCQGLVDIQQRDNGIEIVWLANDGTYYARRWDPGLNPRRLRRLPLPAGTPVQGVSWAVTPVGAWWAQLDPTLGPPRDVVVSFTGRIDDPRETDSARFALLDRTITARIQLVPAPRGAWLLVEQLPDARGTNQLSLWPIAPLEIPSGPALGLPDPPAGLDRVQALSIASGIAVSYLEVDPATTAEQGALVYGWLPEPAADPWTALLRVDTPTPLHLDTFDDLLRVTWAPGDGTVQMADWTTCVR